MKNKYLLISFVALLLIFIITKMGDNKNNDISAVGNCDINIINKKFSNGELKLQEGISCQLNLPAGKSRKITICNKDNLPMEFESHDLNLEKIINPKKRVIINIPFLEKGKKYEFFEEFYGHKCNFLGV